MDRRTLYQLIYCWGKNSTNVDQAVIRESLMSCCKANKWRKQFFKIGLYIYHLVLNVYSRM